MGALKETFKGFWNLLVGLKTTAKYLPRPAVTLQYPSERWTMPERSRGVVVLLSDPDTGELNCNACMVCVKQCPVSAIDVTQAKNEKGERYPATFTIDNTLCCFCGICEEVCNFDAIKLTGKYEFSAFNKSDLIYGKEKLQGLGRDVKYEKKKKPRPAPKPAPKPATGDAQGEGSGQALTPNVEPSPKPSTGAASGEGSEQALTPDKEALTSKDQKSSTGEDAS